MSIVNDKVVLITGGTTKTGQTLVRYALESGAKEIRVFDGNEERLVVMRDELLAQHPETASKVKYYCADVCDSESVDDSMPGAELVLCIPTLKSVTDIESYPADACMVLLGSTDNVMQSAIKYGAEKVVVLSPAYNEPLYKTPDLLAALLEKVVIAQGRYQKKRAETTILCARIDNDIIGLVNFSFAHAKNGDLVLKVSNGYQCQPCYNPNFKRDDYTSL